MLAGCPSTARRTALRNPVTWECGTCGRSRSLRHTCSQRSDFKARKRRAATRRSDVIWDADDGPRESPAEAVTVVHVHYHVHLCAPVLVGTDHIIPATPQRDAITN